MDTIEAPLGSKQIEKLIQNGIKEFAASSGLRYDNPNIFLKFEPECEGWSLSNAYVMTRLAILSYQPCDVVQRQLETSGAGSVEWLECGNTDTQGFICKLKSNHFLCFRGTESFRDARIDTKRIRTGFHPPRRTSDKDGNRVGDRGAEIGRVHRGFKEAFDSVWTESTVRTIEEALSSAQAKVWISGHSLGGALATIAASWIAHRYGGDAIGGVFTIGQPRVGDRKFAQSTIEAFGGEQKAKERMFRIARSLDPVSLVPYFGYKHFTGTRIYISRTGDVLENPETMRKWLERAQSYATLFVRLGLSGGRLSELYALVSDHRSAGYLDALRDEMAEVERNEKLANA